MSRALGAELEALARRWDGRKPRDDEAANAASAVIAALQGVRAQAEREKDAAARRAEEPLRRLAREPVEAARPIAEAELALRIAEHRFAPGLAAAREAAQRRSADLERFKERNRLQRDAVYPESGVLAVALLVAAAAFEALFSAAIFERTSDAGYLGGAVVAIGLGGANVALGFLAGFLGMRYLQHREPSAKVAGGLVLALTVAGGAALNLYAAFWRDQAQAADRLIDAAREQARLYRAGVPPPGEEAASFIGLAAPEATILLMLGAGVFVFAALKGFSGLDDPYPDFGKLDRAARDAKSVEADIAKEARDALHAPLQTAQAELERRLDARRAELAQARKAYDSAADQVAMIGNAEARSLRRAASLLARLDADPPPAPETATDALAQAGALLRQAEERLAECEASAAAGLRRLGDAMETASARLAGNPP